VEKGKEKRTDDYLVAYLKQQQKTKKPVVAFLDEIPF
jgi:late competence protein required for DNA uptake (superfamily II DNA/RNA helicase)